MKEKQIIYYKDEWNDEFSKAKITPREIDETYEYLPKNPLWKMCAFFLQNVVTVIPKFFYAKLKFHIQYIGREKLKDYKKVGFFVYANHTQPFADTFIPSNAIFPKRNFFIVNPENVSMKGLGTIVKMLGAIPIPTKKEAMKNFLNAIEFRIQQKMAITIYPEAHIWPYYTKIRPFKVVSFKYPVQLKTPVFCITNTYQAYGKKKDKVKIVSYIDGPFFPRKDMVTLKEKQQDLRNQVYECMVERSKNSNFEKIEYRKEENKGE